ncbi:MAG: YlxM family DNA-binding protein [Eubacteriaceae bacterium]|jgi:predicted DNA-binding protein YlxM (UPF0122 family)
MEKKVEEQLLYDFYGDLLTDNQKEILRIYYEDDLGLAEIASITGRSRQSVYDTVKRGRRLMTEYESRLGLVKRFLENRKEITEVRSELERLIQNCAGMKPDLIRTELVRILEQLSKIEENS